MESKTVLEKVNSGEGLTVEEIKVYQELVPPVKHAYVKYGTLAKKYLEEHCPAKYWAIDNIPEYLHGVDRAAERMYETMYAKLSALPKYKKDGDFIHNLQVETEIQRLIEEEILNEIVYVQ